jgi:hypothetical protein
MFRGYGFLSFETQAMADFVLQWLGGKAMVFGPHCTLLLNKSYYNENHPDTGNVFCFNAGLLVYFV